MAWRSVESLKKLRAQVTEVWPGVKQDEIGTIGDTAHQATQSDHNPEADGTVDAMDIPHQPEIGLDSYKLADDLLASHDYRIKYIISNSRIGGDVAYGERNNVPPWTWHPYHGTNPHDQHMHISVNDVGQDDPAPWKFSAVQPKEEIWPGSGKCSRYSWYTGKYVWEDKGDKKNSNKLEVPDWAQGISFFNEATLGDWFEVRYPNGFISIEQQTDLGPNPNTGRLIDISAVAAERAGYSPTNFPTDSTCHWRPIPTPALVAAFTKKDQAVAYYKMRTQVALPPPDKPVDKPPPNRPPSQPPAKPVVVHTIDEAFEWANREHLRIQAHLQRLMKEMAPPVAPPSEYASLVQEIMPVLKANWLTLLPLINQLQPSTIAKLVALGLGQATEPAQSQKPVKPQPQGSSLMTQDQIMSAVRWLISTLGAAFAGWAASKGWVSADTIMGWLNSETFIGILVAGIGLFLGQKARTPTAMVSAVAAMPDVKQVVTTKELAKATPSDKVVEKGTM